MEKQKHIRWIIGAVASLMLVGGVVSLISQKTVTFYRGVERQNNVTADDFQTSLLTFNAKEASRQKPAALPSPRVTVVAAGSSRDNGTGASAVDVVVAPRPQGNPIDIPTCEDEGKFTYTGPARRGLITGMCIQCPTEQFISNGTCE